MREKIKNLIEQNDSILLLTHENPDGDAIGSVLAFYHYLKSINKTVDMVILDIPKIFNFLPSINKVVDNIDKDYDLGIIFDCATEKRIGQNDNLLSRCKNTVVIDHHISNTNYADFNLIEGNTSSCCQVIYYLFKDWHVSISNEIGSSIITGVLTDTNGFSTNSVTGETFKLAAEICNLGINIYNIYNKILSLKSMSQYQLMRIAMDRLEFLCDGKIAFTYISTDDFKTVDAIKGEHEGIVDIGRNIEGVEVSIFMREDDGWTVSLRSTGIVDVSEIAKTIGGAGHFMAAGGKINKSFSEAKDIIINEIKKVI